MTRLRKKTFVPHPIFVRILWFGVFFFSVMAIGSFAYVFYEPLQTPDDKGGPYVMFICGVLFVGCAIGSAFSIRPYKTAPVSIDEDGLWPDHLGKGKGLVRWEDVRSVKERQLGQRLELFGENGDSLIRLEYQLTEFTSLRDIVLEKTRRSKVTVTSPAVFKKSWLFHFSHITFFMIPACGAVFTIQTYPFDALVVIGGVIVFFYFVYLRAIVAISITDRKIEIRTPIKSRTFDVSEVKAIQLDEEIVNTSRFPEVRISVTSQEKPIRLKKLGIDALPLHEVLTRWKNGELFAQ